MALSRQSVSASCSAEVLLLGPGLELLEGPVLDLADAFLRDVEQATDLAERQPFPPPEPESEREDLLLAGAEDFHEPAHRLVGIHLRRPIAIRVADRLEQVEVGATLPRGIERDGRSRRGVDEVDDVGRGLSDVSGRDRMPTCPVRSLCSWSWASWRR